MIDADEVLDKIRAEIQAIETGGDSWELAIKEECLGIIDKYKAESEDNE